MATKSFEEFNGELMTLYGQQRFGDVLERLVADGDAYPANASDVLYLRSCMEARLGQPERAIATLQKAIDQGYWYGDYVLRMSPSWQSLQDVPEFVRLADICRARQADAQGEAQLFILEPGGTATHRTDHPLLIALHGNGADGPSALDGWRAVIENGWYLAALKSSQLAGMNAHIWDDQEIAMRELTEQNAALREEQPIDVEKVVLAGFSMGGETALRAALLGTIPVRGFILLGPGGPTIDTPDEWIPLIEGASGRDLRGYVLMGEADDGIPQDAVRQIVDLLNEHGVPTQLETLPNLRHEYPHDFKPYIDRALAFLGVA